MTLQDLPLLRDMSIHTFRQTFEYQNTEQNMQMYLNDNLNEQQLTLEINDLHSQFYIAYYNKVAAGYLKLNFPEKDDSSIHKDQLEVERIYILQDFQRLSIGKQLLDFAKQIAITHSLKSIWLGVWEHNIKAISFYKQYGFVKTGSHVFKLGDDEQTDEIMELKLM
ncbi:MAG: GNAT family N-acetyltransferase [Bacteroidota bacterium]